jgi:L-ribulokinase
MPKTSTPTGYAIGVDYGTNSVRALVVDVADGQEIATAVFDYPSGEAGILLDPTDPNVARQNPQDYIDGFLASVKQAVEQAANVEGFDPAAVVGIGVDTTGSTRLPVDEDGQPLAMSEAFKDHPAAQAWLWKDHTSHAEAAEITQKASRDFPEYLAKCGGTYSSEWYWSKILRCCRAYPEVFDAVYSWVELADFVPGYITGRLDPDTMARCICAAGHKAMYHEDWSGLPSEAFLESLDPKLVRLRGRYFTPAIASDERVGGLTVEVAEKVGLPAGLPVAAGGFDAHHGAVGSGCKPGTLVKIMGTSTCDCMVAPPATGGDNAAPGSNIASIGNGKEAEQSGGIPGAGDIPGVCGVVPGSILPGMIGIEAGQSAVGDIFNWFVKHLTPRDGQSDAELHTELTRQAEQLKPGASGLLALDWNNGNRTVLVDPLLTGLLLGQTLHTTAAEVYRTLIEATAFGALAIINRLEEHGVMVEQVINCGGIAEKNPMAMQIYADICNRPMKVSASQQTCALGAAIFGAVVGGAYPDTLDAQANMTRVKDKVYQPIPANVKTYAKLYALYLKLHDAFGGVDRSADLSHVMKDLIEIRDAARKKSSD